MAVLPTLAEPSELYTGNASNIRATTATLNGRINPNGATTSAWFAYGTTTAYGNIAAATLTPNDGTTAQDVSTVIGGLAPGQTYHYRFLATTYPDYHSGEDMSFVTMLPPPIAPSELIAPQLSLVGNNIDLTVGQSLAGRRYQVQQSNKLDPGSWTSIGTTWLGDGSPLVITIQRDPKMRQRFYRLVLDPTTPITHEFALIPAGVFMMGDQSDPLVGNSDELPVHSVYVHGFYMGRYEVTKELWDAVRAWGLNNGYADLPAGNGSYASKGANHPVHSISWYEMVKWCNARSEKEGLTPCYRIFHSFFKQSIFYKVGEEDDIFFDWSANGFRLPTEAEWEKAARGGRAIKNFPWGGDTISHNEANYRVFSANGSTNYWAYDVTARPPGAGTYYYHPAYLAGGYPYSSPVGSFAPNSYGLYDMTGNVWEWCWDWFGPYDSSSQTDPRGPATGSTRVFRGSGWRGHADGARCSARRNDLPGGAGSYFDGSLGFRVVRGPP
jgi:formylglycine-generating enzyme required for sulfatase activity